MNDLWLKIKVWTKGLLVGAIVLYAIFFVAENTSEKSVKLWWWFGHEHNTSVFVLAAGAFVAGMIFMLVLATTWRTMRQLRELRTRSRIERAERNQLDVQTKAAMLQSRDEPSK